MTMFSFLIDEIQDTTVSELTKRQLRALTRITDLFAAGSGRHSRKKIERFDEVFKILVAVIELKTRIKLARYLATIPDAPAISSPTRIPRARVIFTQSRIVKHLAK